MVWLWDQRRYLCPQGLSHGSLIISSDSVKPGGDTTCSIGGAGGSVGRNAIFGGSVRVLEEAVIVCLRGDAVMVGVVFAR